MKLFSKALPLAAFCSATAFASSVTYQDLSTSSPVTYPGKEMTWPFIQDASVPYSLNTTCTDIGSNGKFKSGVFKVNGFSHRVKTNKVTKYNGSVVEYDCLNAIQYQVTCGNGLTYNATLGWQQRDTCSTGFCYTENYTQKNVKSLKTSKGDFYVVSHVCKNMSYIPETVLFNLWNARKVDLPLTTNGSNKLKRPIVFVPGHNSSFVAFGGIPMGKNDENDSRFRGGYVSGYTPGSLPDVIARDQRLDMSTKGIKTNGLYFFMAPYTKKDGKYVQVSPQWKGKDTRGSISSSLYNYLENILRMHYGTDWWKKDANQVDLVAHSQGGLVIREMLRGLRADAKNFPTGGKNAANHIRRVITVNTPHFGSELADDYQNIQKSMPATAAFIKEVQEQITAEKKKGSGTYVKNNILLSADVEKDLKAFFEKGAGKNLAAWALSETGHDSPIAVTAGEFLVPTDLITGIIGITAHANVEITGSYIGDFNLKTKTRVLGGLWKDETNHKIDFLKPMRDTLWAWHVNGAHLGTHSSFIQNLNREGYPKLPNGKNLEMRPMYSKDMRGIRNYFTEQLSKGSSKFCMEKSTDRSACFAVTSFLNMLVYKSEGVKLTNFKYGQKWLDFYNNLIDEWFGTSDLLVTAYSQQYVDQKQKLGPKYQKEFLQPKTYDIYLSQVPKTFPYNVVPHGDVLEYGTVDSDNFNVHLQTIRFEGASRKGLDLYCALDDSKCTLGSKKVRRKESLKANGGFV